LLVVVLFGKATYYMRMSGASQTADNVIGSSLLGGSSAFGTTGRYPNDRN
jgi:hypothetical protein